MGAVNLADAKAHLSELVSRAESGEETVITTHRVRQTAESAGRSRHKSLTGEKGEMHVDVLA